MTINAYTIYIYVILLGVVAITGSYQVIKIAVFYKYVFLLIYVIWVQLLRQAWNF